MKTKHNTVKVVLVTLLVFMLLSWILPAAYFQGSYIEQGRVQMGIADLFSYPTTALSYFGYIAVYLLVVGGFYGVLNKIGAYRTLLDKLSASFKKHGKVILSAMMVLLAVITSICGLQLGLIMFFPFLVSLILLMGYDKIVAALTLVGSTMIGIAGSTFAFSNTNIIMSTLSLKITSNMLVKVIILVLGLVLLILNTMLYISKIEKEAKKAKKKQKAEEKKEAKTTKTSKSTKKTAEKGTKTTKKTTKKTVAAEKVEEVKVITAEKTEEFIPTKIKGKHKVWPLAVVFSLMFIIMILAFISWTGAFNNTLFEDITENVKKFEIFDFALFGKILGNVQAFGNWTLIDLMGIMIISLGLLMVVYKIKFRDGLEAFAEGAKKALEPAVLVVLIYTILVAVTYHPFQLVIYKFLFGFTKGFNIITSTIAAMLASLFNADPLYAFQSVLPYLTSLVSKKSTLAIAGVVYQSVYGVTMLVAPTSVVLMTVLSYLGISYKEWFKNIWKLLLELLALLLIIFVILILI